MLLPLVSGILGNLILKLRNKRVSDDLLLVLLRDLKGDLGITRDVSLLLADEGQMPMTFGFLRPCVVLPADAMAWSAERRRIVLLHELAHVKRHDVAWQIVARMGCAVYWFHPLVWWALGRMRMDRELACDDCVLAAGHKASGYATHLLEIARVHRSCSPFATAALSMARRSQLEGRLLAVLDSGRTRTPLGPARAAGLLLSTIAAVTALGVIRPALRAEPTVASSGGATPAAAAANASQSTNTVAITGTVLSPTGKPMAGAQIELVAMNDNTGWPIYRTQKQEVQYRTTSTDSSGRFELSVAKTITGKYPALWTFVSAEGMATHQEWLAPRLSTHNVEIKLSEAKKARVQLVDAIGNPLDGVTPELWHANTPKGENTFWLPDPEARALVKSWPKWTKSDSQGYTSAELAADMTVQLLVEDERFGRQINQFKLADEPVAVALRPGLHITGTVTAANDGKAIEGAEVLLLERPFRRVRSGADGKFAIASALGDNNDRTSRNEVKLQVYPPADSPYMFLMVERSHPGDGSQNLDIPVKLRRGVVIEGQVVEQGNGRPVAGAKVFARQQEYGNLLYIRGSHANYSGTDMNYATDAEGRFRMPVGLGPGYLLVKAPTIDYVHVLVSAGDKYYGKPGLQREYHDGALKIKLKAGETPSPVRIELQRGVTLRRKVVCPGGQPATGTLHSRSYLVDATDISGYAPALRIENGVLELPGFDPEHSNPLFILDPKHHCGLAASPSESDSDAPLQLLPCGSAKLRVVDDSGAPRTDYEPRLHLVVTPGAPATHRIEANQPFWSDTILWQNVFWNTVDYEKALKTDGDGQVVIDNLIPGATYTIGFVNKKGSWDEGFEFTVQSGQTTDVGNVVIPDHN